MAWVRVTGLLASALVCIAAQGGTPAVDIDTYWEYGDPAGSEQRFRAALADASGDTQLELLTQIARTYSLRRCFADAHAVLNEVEPKLPAAGAAPRVRYLLERGRTFNSAGEKARAKPLFIEAYDLALAAKLDGLAVDAAHMVPIVATDAEAALWTERGLALARTSTDRKARALLPALLNNHAWNLQDSGRHAEALPVFREAEAAWHATGRQPQGRIATWSVARCLRSLGRFDEALALQRGLERAFAEIGAPDGYVFEEIAELLLATDRRAESRPYFERAASALGRDPAFAKEQAARLQRLRELARD
ncbi:MAG: tetratricopeptide repeat protein [Burkholderiaceae bacterium]|nr:tetratricopeptide repeat protein [Burkholderiaceae bacterium]